MKVSILEIRIGDTHVGHLFKYGDIVRLRVAPAFAEDPVAPIISLSLIAGQQGLQAAFLLDPFNPALNSLGSGKLPAFFQNLLPEGLLRTHIAQERGCAEDDYFELLAACGADLPGNVYALPAHDPGLVTELVTQHHDAVEMSIVADPLEDGVSLSGMQPKLALIRDGGRFAVGRHLGCGHVIGKLPTPMYELLPEVEHLSLRLARAAGADVCNATLEPMSLINAEQHFWPGTAERFLAVERFDRDQPGRVHVEDFAQVFGLDPGRKYVGASYADVARVLLFIQTIGETGVHELMRRIAINELLGNMDCHLKNIGLLHYADRRIGLAPAYDIVAYCVFRKGLGHALRFTGDGGKRAILDAKTLRAFAAAAGVTEEPLRRVVKQVCEAALDTWPAMIADSEMHPAQQARLDDFFRQRPMIQSLLRRRRR